MESDVPQVQETQLHPSSSKVHLAMCTKLLGLVDIISSVFPDIEAARPSCSSGIKSLALLQKAIEKANELVHNCCKSSKLYLALTGDVIVARFEHARNLMQQSLRELQSMVPMILEFEISEILNNLEDTVFFLDSHEVEAGKALRALLQQDETLVKYGNSEIEVLQFAAARLHLTSQKDLLIERRSIRKLLNEVKEQNSTKSSALRYLMHLLKKYDKKIMQEKLDGESLTTDSTNLESCSTYAQDEPRSRILPPEEFLCPLSSRLMFDPIIISSGQTYERNSIQKWFEKGHDICPRTGLKLVDLSVTSNSVMRDMIIKWSMEHGIIVSPPSPSLEASSSSISSSATSLHSSYSDDDSYNFEFFYDIDDIKRQLLSNLSGLAWESQTRAVHDVNYYLTYYNPSCALVSSQNFVQPLIQFLKDSLDKQDVEAQKAGSQLFLTFLRATRKETTDVSKDVFSILASFLEREAAEESLDIMEVMSSQVSALPNLAASSVLNSIMKVLDSPNGDHQRTAIRILHNLSLNIEPSSSCKLLASDWIPKLVHFLGDKVVGSNCIVILKNLCKFEEARVFIAETDGCIASIIELLETGNSEDQEHAMGILLSLCAQTDEYCHLVLDEGIVPSLCHVSVNGNKEAKASASELLRILRDVKYVEEEDYYPRSNVPASNHEVPENFDQKTKKSSFGRKMKMLLKRKLMLSAH